MKKPDKKELRKFAITISSALCVLGSIILWRRGQAGSIYIAVGAVFFFAGLVWPNSLALLYKAWMALALVLGLIMSHIILALVFFVVLTPIGFIMKIVRKNPLERSLDCNAKSYWIKRQKKINDKTSYEKMF